MAALIYIPSDAVDPLIGLFQGVSYTIGRGYETPKEELAELLSILSVFTDQLIDDKRSIEHQMYLNDLKEHPKEVTEYETRGLSSRIAEYAPRRLTGESKGNTKE